MSSSDQKSIPRALRDLITLSREYGTDDCVIAGGGNSSVKLGDELWVKKSGTELAGANELAFIPLDRPMLDTVLAADYPEDSGEREAMVKRGLLRSMLRPDAGGRPTVEASLHNLLDYRFVLHTHPWQVNALTSSRDGLDALKRLFGDRAVVLPYCNPGYTLAIKLRQAADRYQKLTGTHPRIIFLQNHGLIVAANKASEIRTLMADVMEATAKRITPLPKTSAPVSPAKTSITQEQIAEIVNVIRSALSTTARKTTTLLGDALTREFCANAAAFRAVALPFTPDQIVYCGSHPLWVPAPKPTAGGGAGNALAAGFTRAIAAYRAKHGIDPKVICVQGVGVVTVGDTAREAATVRDVFVDAMRIAFASRKTGGPRPMTAKARAFIESWEVEKYRRSVATGAPRAAHGKVGGARTAVVTGGAQGFGEGIVRSLFADGFNVVIADLNEERGAALAAELNTGVPSDAPGTKTGVVNPANRAAFVTTNVTREESVSGLMAETVLRFGGCDLFVSNAGVVKAGGLDEIDTAAFDFQTSVNYTGYFICAKYASAVMKRQHEHAPHLQSDIIQINSKSGLEGSNRNFGYAGSKFGGLGLTQSFALELMPSGIKVNSICPGNFLDGPLWSDPRRGLFVQYLEAGKVPGAKTVADVRRSYEAKVPAGRGCTVEDVMRALHYVIGQEYETGQAVPVTGGQIMLK